jgi:pyruvate/2-oxoacid:ferredoxin oxidoreductase alpha subunit
LHSSSDTQIDRSIVLRGASFPKEKDFHNNVTMAAAFRLRLVTRRVAACAATATTRTPFSVFTVSRALASQAGTGTDGTDNAKVVDASKIIETQMAAMNQSVEAMKTNYAVDAPDGVCDGRIEEELEQVKHIMDDTGKPKKKKKKKPPKKDDDTDPDPFGIHIH